MSTRRRVVEAGKTVLIALLAVSALFLAWRTRLFNGFFNAVPFFGNVAVLMRGASGTAETSGAVLKEAARPICIVITDEEGNRYGEKYDIEARNAVYDRISSIMSESLGSATELQEISEAEWRSALSGPGVFFEYAMPVKLPVLDGWLGAHMTECPDFLSLTHIYVAFGEDRSRIYLQDHGSGVFFGADTASSAGKAQELDIYSPNGALFAFETGIDAAENSPYMLVMPGGGHPDIRAGTAGSAADLLDIVLAALGHSDEMPAILPEADGALRCVGTQFNISVDARGYVFYRPTDNLPPTEDRQALSESEMIERARVIVAETIGGQCGSAEVFFESLEQNAGYASVNFGYYAAGGRVHLHDDVNAARISFLSGTVRSIELNFRNFTLTDDYTALLPERQALAAAGGEFILCYSDTGVESIQPAWARR